MRTGLGGPVARSFLNALRVIRPSGDLLLRDRDGKFARIFDTILRSSGIDVKKLPIRSPNLNAFTERFIQTLKHECLNHFVIPGHKHLDYPVATFVDYHHKQRPYPSKDNEPLLKLTELKPGHTDGDVPCEERLRGLLKHCYRKEI